MTELRNFYQQIKEVTFASESLKLTGFLAHPTGKRKPPAVMFIHGGGKYSQNIYESWQEYLLQQGIASLSYYCRGVGSSEGNFLDASLANRLVDSLAAYNYLKNTVLVDDRKICIYGSSMGAHVAVRLIEKLPHIKVILLQSAAAYKIEAENLPLNETFTRAIADSKLDSESSVFPIIKKFRGAVYVVYGKYDRVIPDHIKDLYRAAIVRGEYREIENGAHRLLRPESDRELAARNELYRSTVEFIRKYS